MSCDSGAGAGVCVYLGGLCGCCNCRTAIFQIVELIIAIIPLTYVVLHPPLHIYEKAVILTFQRPFSSFRFDLRFT